VASFSRALVEGLSVEQSDAEYNALLDESIQSIFEASSIKTGDHVNSGKQQAG
jgi:fructose-bisphosphate aldolase class 1